MRDVRVSVECSIVILITEVSCDGGLAYWLSRDGRSRFKWWI